MTLDFKPTILPMEAQSVEELPIGAHWQYEPKWDGFRCLTFRDGEDVFLQSKSGLFSAASTSVEWNVAC